MPCTARLDLNVSAASRRRSHTHTLFSRTLFSRTLRTLGGAWRHPQRDAAGDANGHPCRDRRPIGRRHFSAAGSGGIPAPPNRGHGMVPPIGGTVYRRRRIRRRQKRGGGVVPARQPPGRWLVRPERCPAKAGHGVRCRLIRCRQLAARYVVPPDTVPSIDGTVLWRHGSWRHGMWPGGA